jgi:hypothetical protein
VRVEKLKRSSSEAYADFTLSRIPYHVRVSLSDEQYDSIRKALIASDLESKHRIDIRLRLPLFLRAYYFVFFAGRDRRTRVHLLEMNRINRLPTPLRRACYIGASTLIGLSLLVSVFIVLYLVKSGLGIDIFPNFHLHDILPFDLFLPPK